MASVLRNLFLRNYRTTHSSVWVYAMSSRITLTESSWRNFQISLIVKCYVHNIPRLWWFVKTYLKLKEIYQLQIAKSDVWVIILFFFVHNSFRSHFFDVLVKQHFFHERSNLLWIQNSVLHRKVAEILNKYINIKVVTVTLIEVCSSSIWMTFL